MLTPDNTQKRYVSKRDIQRRDWSYVGMPLQRGDQPWFCFFNSTVNEFFIYLDKDRNTSITTVPTSSTAGSTLPTSTMMAQEQTGKTTSTSQTPTFAAYNPTPASPYPSPSTTYGKRSFQSSNPYATEYPKMIKMLEKRKPGGNVPPYCQKMQVLDDWDIVPIPTVAPIWITENDYDGPNKKLRRDSDTTSQLESNCVCEWISN